MNSNVRSAMIGGLTATFVVAAAFLPRVVAGHDGPAAANFHQTSVEAPVDSTTTTTDLAVDTTVTTAPASTTTTAKAAAPATTTTMVAPVAPVAPATTTTLMAPVTTTTVDALATCAVVTAEFRDVSKYLLGATGWDVDVVVSNNPVRVMVSAVVEATYASGVTTYNYGPASFGPSPGRSPAPIPGSNTSEAPTAARLVSVNGEACS